MKWRREKRGGGGKGMGGENFKKKKNVAKSGFWRLSDWSGYLYANAKTPALADICGAAHLDHQLVFILICLLPSLTFSLLLTCLWFPFSIPFSTLDFNFQLSLVSWESPSPQLNTCHQLPWVANSNRGKAAALYHLRIT